MEVVRPIQAVYISTHFEKTYNKLSAKQKNSFISKEQLLRKNIFDPKLRAHKLKGKLNNYWSFSLSYSDRVLFKFLDTKSILLIDIGSHQIYQ